MTEHSNPLMNRPRLATTRAAFVDIDGQQVPTDLDEYCAYRNSRELRKGVWVVAQDGDTGARKLDFRTEVATEGWLRDNGLLPKIGRRA